MRSQSSSAVFAVCVSILSGSIGAAFGRHFCGCEPVVLADPEIGSHFGRSQELVRPGEAEMSRDVLAREAVSTADDVGAKQTSRIAELEAEIARLRSEMGTTRFASMLVATAPPDQPVRLAEVMRLLDDSYLTELPELRAMVTQEVRQDAALDLLREEIRFRDTLITTRNALPNDRRTFEWPSRRDQLVQDFVLRLSGAGLSGRTIEHYRGTLVDYLDG